MVIGQRRHPHKAVQMHLLRLLQGPVMGSWSASPVFAFHLVSCCGVPCQIISRLLLPVLAFGSPADRYQSQRDIRLDHHHNSRRAAGNSL